MIDFVKKYALVILALAIGAAALLSLTGNTEDSLDAVNQTTFTNPIVFESTVAVEDDFNYLESTETLTVDDTLTIAEAGKVIYIGTAGVDVTIPTAATSAGVTYRVVVSANFATTNMTITGGAADASDDLIFGALEVAGAVVPCSAEDTISFVNTAELPGDYVELHSNGVNWFITGQATTVGAITCTDAD